MRKRLLVTLAALTLAVSSLSGCFDDEWDETGYVDDEDYDDESDEDYVDETDEDYDDANDGYSDEDDGYFNFSDDPNEEQEPITQEMEEVNDEEDEEYYDDDRNPVIDEFVGTFEINGKTIEIWDDYMWAVEGEGHAAPYKIDGDILLLIDAAKEEVLYKVQPDQNGDLYDFLSGETLTKIGD